MSNEGASRRTAFSTVNTIAASSTASSLGIELQYITVCASGGALTIRFGNAAVGAAQATDWPIAEGEKESFYITSNTNYVSIQGVGALKWVAG
jgi:hypothetical protein